VLLVQSRSGGCERATPRFVQAGVVEQAGVLDESRARAGAGSPDAVCDQLGLEALAAEGVDHERKEAEPFPTAKVRQIGDPDFTAARPDELDKRLGERADRRLATRDAPSYASTTLPTGGSTPLSLGLREAEPLGQRKPPEERQTAQGGSPGPFARDGWRLGRAHVARNRLRAIGFAFQPSVDRSIGA
jgi:hypothetical protein